MEQTLLILGLNHRTAPVAVRELLAFAGDEIPAALRRLKSAAPSIREVALLSTCNRVEVVAAAQDPAGAADQATRFLAADRNVEPAAFAAALNRIEGREAVRHLFRVGASLDSMVV